MKTNPFEVLINDHKELKKVMTKINKQITENNSDNIKDMFGEFRELFNLHDKAEDNIVYPVIKEHKKLSKLILKGYQAHHMVEIGILELRITPYDSETWGPKFLVIQDSILSHMEEEETLVFPAALKLIPKKKLYSVGEALTASRE